MPMSARMAMKVSADDEHSPTLSHSTKTRMTMLVETAAMLALPISFLFRLSDVFFFMYAVSGAAANIEKNEEKKPNHDVWKARMCGLSKLVKTIIIENCDALCSASTGTENSRPKMSVVPRELTPCFSRAECRALTSCSSFCSRASYLADSCSGVIALDMY